MAPTPTLHVPLNGNLNGTDSGAPIVADGYGALRYRASDIGGRQCALVEEATTNYFLNPRFGNGTTGWSTIFASAINVDTVRTKDGHDSLRVTCPGSVPNERIVSAKANSALTVTPSQPITFAFEIAGDVSATMDRQVTIYNVSDGAVQNFTGPTYGLTSPWARRDYSVTPTDPNANNTRVAVRSTAAVTMDFYVTETQLEAKDHATSYCDGSLGTGYAWAGTPHASASTRALTTIEIPYTGAVEHILFRYSEDFGATWATASMTADGTFGSYGSIDYTANVFTIESSRALMIRSFAVYADELTAGQLTAAEAAVANGTIGSRSGNTAGLLLPV